MNTHRLNRIIALRRRVRDRVSAAASEAGHRLAAGRAQIEAAEAAEAAYVERATEALREMTSVRTVRLIEAERRSHAAHIARRCASVDALERDVQTAQEELRERTRELKVSERVHDRRLAARDTRENKHEQRTVDDIVGARFGETR